MIAGFTWYQIFAYFLAYSFLGWCTEVVYAAVTTGQLVNRGFLNGPVCPIYGFGMLAVLVLLTPVAHAEILLFLGGMLLTSVIELVGGWALFKAYHARWWDYSERPFNLGGYICLEFSILWGIGTMVMVRIIHPTVAGIIRLIPQNVGWFIMAGLYILYAIDAIVTFFVAAGLNRDLAALETVAASLREVSDKLTNTMGTTALTADQKMDEGRLQLMLAKAEASDKAAAARVALTDAAGVAAGTAAAKAAEAAAAAKAAKDMAAGAATAKAAAAVQAAAAARDLAADTAASKAAAAAEMAAAARDLAAKTSAQTRAELEARYTALEARADALRADVLMHTVFGGGRLLKAFPDMKHIDHRDALDELKKRLKH